MLTNRIVCHLAKRKAALVSPKGVCFQIENKASPKIYTALKNKEPPIKKFAKEWLKIKKMHAARLKKITV